MTPEKISGDANQPAEQTQPEMLSTIHLIIYHVLIFIIW